MASIDALAVRDVGSVAEALAQAKRMVHDAKEARDMFQRLLSRLEYTKTVLQNRDESEDEGERVKRFVEALGKFMVLLSSHVALGFPARVVRHFKLMFQMRAIHDLLDGVFRGMEDQDVGKEWREELNEDWQTHSDALKATITHPSALAEEIKSVYDFQEAMGMLKSAEESRDPNQWNKITQDLRNAVLQMDVPVEVMDGDSWVVPSWFVSPIEVVYHAKGFARGSFASVHHGTWEPGTEVVIQTTYGDRLGGFNVEAFIKMADLWATFTHPNIIRLYGACHITSPNFFICEDATKGNMAEYLARHPHVYNTRIYRLLVQAALGFDYLHSNGVVPET